MNQSAQSVPMLQQNLFNSQHNEPDDVGWAERATHWLQHKPKKGRGRPSKEMFRQPLILSGHGASLAVKHGALAVRNGFTHYPQNQETWRFFPGDRRLPSRIILLDGNGSLSFDVLTWLSVQNIQLVQINWQGEVVTIGSQRPLDNSLYEAQLAARGNGSGFTLACKLVREKILSSIETLDSLLPSAARTRGYTQLARAIKDLDQHVAQNIEELRLVEGRAALAYFRALQKMPIHWKSVRQRPVPEEWQFIPMRTSGKTGTNRHATHPFNAMLNYAYGVLESQVRIDTIAAGLDPTIGYLHATVPGRVALVYDLMEPLRPTIDRALLKFVSENDLMPGDFTVSSSGVCRVHPQLARSICSQIVGLNLVAACSLKAEKFRLGAIS